VDELTSENSFVCEKCGRHLMDGNMCILSNTKTFEGLICINCSEMYYPKQLRHEVDRRNEIDRRNQFRES
jgi:hypothetical protein